MLNCEKCNYVMKMNGRNTCELTGFIFKKSFEDYEMDFHPCYEYSIDDLNTTSEEGMAS